MHLTQPAAVCFACAIFLSSGQVIADGDVKMATITVSGQATKKVVPDTIIIRFSVVSRDRTPTLAAAASRKKSAEIIAFLKSQRIDEKSIESESVRLKPIFAKRSQYSKKDDLFGKPQSNSAIKQVNLQQTAQVSSPEDLLKQTKPIGYEATRAMSVSLGDPKRFEAVHEGILERGVTEISQVTRHHSDSVSLRQKTRLQALSAAKSKAQEMASVLDATLGRPIEISEQFTRPTSNRMMMGSDDPFVGPEQAFSMGTIEITESVRVVFELDAE